ncbi:MAG: glycosyltransferase family A protein [Pedobacter sp.]|uniref:glycosyltransferase family 2 protein n=1 Tax=Pedobacter sp. TaxID=1411316 RepID=UPI00339B66A6
MKTEYPLITCICITSNRIAKLQKAISYFKLQDYPNKELIISYPIKDKLTRYIIDRIISAGELRIIKLERDDKLSLGEARNQAVAKSNGEYICTWDDDDWYHVSRLSYQYHNLKESGGKFKASILNQLILYDATTQRAYLSFLYPWENTLLCKREVFTEYQYSNMDRGEDSNIIDMLDATRQLLHIGGAPFLYVYVYHDGNTWGYSHFKSFLKRSRLLDDELANSVAQMIE